VFGARYQVHLREWNWLVTPRAILATTNWSLIRSRIKTVHFGVPYGAGPTRVALMTGMSIDEAQSVHRGVLWHLQGAEAVAERQGLLAVELGYSCSPEAGRFYTLPADDAEDARS